MPLTWIEGLKAYNMGMSSWCVPRKGTPAYDEITKLRQRTTPAEVEKRNVERRAKAMEQFKAIDTRAKIEERRKLVKVGMKSTRLIVGEGITLKNGRYLREDIDGYAVVYALGDEGKVPDRPDIAVEFYYEDGRELDRRAIYKYVNENKVRLRYDVKEFISPYKYSDEDKENLKTIVFTKPK
jgi:hypothetical protein